ncbi:MAG: sigma-70 family RNA polymerase sigma factor [Psychrobacillus sp.]
MLNEEKIKKFEMENPEFLKNNLVTSFLKIPVNNEVFMATISNPTPENMEKLDILFKNFYFRIRFISHISTTLKFNSINYDKRARLVQNRFSLTLDAPINPFEGDGTFLDLTVDEQAESYFDDNNTNNQSLDEQITCPILHDAFHSLTDKQKEVINLSYVKGLSDTEIGLLLNKSQQAVSKIHKKALANMFNHIKSKENVVNNKDRGNAGGNRTV